MVSGKALFIEGETKYEAGRVAEAFELYRRAVIQILNHEDVLQKLPGIPEVFPQELLACIWQNLLGCFKSDDPRFTRDAYPSAYELVYSFRSAASKAHPQFKGTQGKRLLKAMQISAGLTLGILAWKQGDRSTAAKRYQEALDVAATHPQFNGGPAGLKHLDRIAAEEVQQIRENLATLIQNDSINAAMAGSGQGTSRKEVLNSLNARMGIDGTLTPQANFVIATDACGKAGCNNRGVSLKRCSACKKIAYCGVECQKEDWKQHKKTCKQDM
ncbi:hypothetical protein C8R45DRAFT_953793 [Mycena sanguinolenta]|nr:hypothetical protein C8R45DRAFT_953793 [Mycena sanguinolenta]